MRLIIVIIILLFSSAPNAEIHMNLDDKVFYKSKPISVSHDGVDLSIMVYYEKSISNKKAYSKAFVENVSKQTMEHLFPFMNNKGLKKMSCGLNPQKLNIYVVSWRILNDRSRFSILSLENEGIDNNSRLVGYYDPTHYDSKTDSIILTNISTARNNTLLAHEISHYFYNRFCIKTQTLQNTEPFAAEFQKYYLKLSGLRL